MAEIRDIPGRPGYRVDDAGVVYSAWRLIPWHGCVVGEIWKPVKRTLSARGYVRVKLNGHKKHSVHRLVLEAFVGPCPEGMLTRHLDGNKQNNRRSNLAWGTPTENMLDRASHGRTACGEANTRAKLTEEKVRYILANRRLTASVLAARFDVSTKAVYLVWQGKSWKHLPR